MCRCCLAPGWAGGCSFTRLCGALPASDRARGTSFPDHERGVGGGVLDQTIARNPDTGIRSAGQGQDETLKYHQ